MVFSIVVAPSSVLTRVTILAHSYQCLPFFFNLFLVFNNSHPTGHEVSHYGFHLCFIGYLRIFFGEVFV